MFLCLHEIVMGLGLLPLEHFEFKPLSILSSLIIDIVSAMMLAETGVSVAFAVACLTSLLSLILFLCV